MRGLEAVNRGYGAAENYAHGIGHEILLDGIGYLFIDNLARERNMSLVVKLSGIILFAFFRLLSHKNSNQESSVGSIYL